MVNKRNHAKMAELFRLVNDNCIYPDITIYIYITLLIPFITGLITHFLSDLLRIPVTSVTVSDPQWPSVALSGLLAKEAETRRNAFLAACRGPSQKLPARCSSELSGGILEVGKYPTWWTFTVCNGTIHPCFMGKSTINGNFQLQTVSLPEGIR